MLRLVERIGLRRQQVFATQADTVERLRNIAKLSEIAAAYMRREPHATPREFARYLAAVAEAGLREDEPAAPVATPAVRVMTMHAAKGLEFDHVFVLGLSATRMPGPRAPPPRRGAGRPAQGDAPRGATAARPTTTRCAACCTWRSRARARGSCSPGPRAATPGATPRPSPFYEEARAALDAEEELFEEELFGPAEGLHSTFRIMRDELLDTVARVGGRLGEMRLDTYLDVDQAIARYIELMKVAALIERAKSGQTVADALPEVNEILLQGVDARAARGAHRLAARRVAARRRARRRRRPAPAARRRASPRSTRSSRAAARA